MKTNLLINLKWALLSVALFVTAAMYAGAGFHETDAVKVKFDVNGSSQEKSLNLYNQGDYDLGTVSSLKFTSIYATIWKHYDSGNCCGVRMHYVIYPQGSRITNFLTTDYAGYKDDWDADNAKHQHWEKSDYNIDLLSGIGNGDYVMECYFEAKGSTSNTSSCDDYAFTANNNDGKNYFFKFKKVGGSTECDLQSGTGNNLATNTTVFFDNSTLNFDNVFVSVVADENKNITPVMAKSGYKPKSDKFYSMTCGENNIWKATITGASNNAKLCFWNKDIHDYNNLNDCSVAYLVLYDKDKNLYKPENVICEQQSSLKFYTKGTWSVIKMLELETSVSSYSLDDIPGEIVLTANSYGIKGTKYSFEYRAFDEPDFTPLSIQDSPVLKLTADKIPFKSTYYRVSYGDGTEKTTSERIRISVIQNCDNGKIVYENTFDKVDDEVKLFTSLTERRSDPNMTSDYTFQDYPRLIDDGDYAVVATPRYCGCGIGSSQNCFQCHDVHHCKCKKEGEVFIQGDICNIDDCSDASPWFRDIKDNTYKGEGGKYGGMLFINFKNGKSNIAYSHELTADEKKLFVAGSTLNFSAYFANATKDNSSTSQPINMDLVIEYRAVGSSKWEEQTKVTSKVTYDEEWKQCSASIDLESNDGDYRIVVKNHGGTGVGNDVLIDDITLKLCVPTYMAEYYDKEKTPATYMSAQINKLSDSETIRIPDKNYGLGANPCVYLLKIDESKTVGSAGRFAKLADMSRTTIDDNSYYVATVSDKDLLNDVPEHKSGKLQVVVTQTGECESELANILNGTVHPDNPGSKSSFSQNLLTYELVCSDIITPKWNEEKIVCEESDNLDLPSINVTFGNVSEFVKYTLIEDNTKTLITSKELTSSEIAAGIFTIDLNEVSGVVRTSGNHTFTVTKTEYFTNGGDVICEKTAPALTLVVVEKPSYNATIWPESIDYCTTKTISVNVTSPDPVTYQWYVSKNAAGVASDWELIEGATAAKYNLPADATDGWLYKVVLDNGYCTVTETTPVRLTKTSGVAPTVTNYDKCATKESDRIALSTLVTSSYTNLTWYKDDKTTKVSDATFDASVPTSEPIIYYVTDTPNGGCESELSESVSVMVKKSAVAPTVKNYDECKDSSKPNLDLSTLIVNPSAGTQYKFYDETGAEIDKTVSISTSGVKTYSVGADAADGCGFEPVKITVTVKNTIESISLTPEEENIVLGGSVTKTLSYEPSAAAKTIDWTINGATFDGVFPRKPYTDEVYKVTITDECGNKFNASAKITVEWPTIFMPYDNGTNKDFVVGIDGGIEIYVFDRTGNMVAHSLDGWDGFANQNGNTKIAMPGLYYYKAILPDGSVKKGTVEVFKK